MYALKHHQCIYEEHKRRYNTFIQVILQTRNMTRQLPPPCPAHDNSHLHNPPDNSPGTYPTTFSSNAYPSENFSPPGNLALSWMAIAQGIIVQGECGGGETFEGNCVPLEHLSVKWPHLYIRSVIIWQQDIHNFLEKKYHLQPTVRIIWKSH